MLQQTVVDNNLLMDYRGQWPECLPDSSQPRPDFLCSASVILAEFPGLPYRPLQQQVAGQSEGVARTRGSGPDHSGEGDARHLDLLQAAGETPRRRRLRRTQRSHPSPRKHSA